MAESGGHDRRHITRACASVCEAGALVSDTDIDAVLSRFYNLHPLSIDLSLGRIRGLMNKLGNPENKVSPVVHVAGTNGKGSTIACMRAILEKAGYACHVFTSPHLVRFNERVRLAGKLIDNDLLMQCLRQVEAVNNGDPITFFELTYAAAFLAFSKIPADILLLETGLGGRLDATNIISAPLLSIITKISYDHCDFLGNTIEKIAAEKAGIIKNAAPCILAQQLYPEQVRDVISRQAMAMQSPLIDAQDHTDLCRHLSLQGTHQIENASTAITALHVLQDLYPDKYRISDDDIVDGLANVFWPARLQRLYLSERYNGGDYNQISADTADWAECEIWLDGGHNDSAGRVLSQEVQKWQSQDDKPLHVILGMVNTKDPVSFFDGIAPYVTSLSLVPVEGQDNSFEPEELKHLLRPCHSIETVQTYANWELALQHYIKDKGRGRILITGSLYLAGTVLQKLEMPII